MSKYKFVGSKLKNASDLSLAKSHKEGAVVELVQPAKDNRWGRYYFIHYKRYYLLLNESRKHYNRALLYLKKCRQVPVNEKTRTRHISDDIRDKLEVHSMQYLMLLKTGYEYMTLEMLPSIDHIQQAKQGIPKTEWDKVELLDRIKELKSKLPISRDIPESLFPLFDRRDIVEHPTSERLYNCSENGWKNNHLAWVLSGDMEGTMEKIVHFTNEVIEVFEKYVKDNPIPGTLEGVVRGLKSTDSYKKSVTKGKKNG